MVSEKLIMDTVLQKANRKLHKGREVRFLIGRWYRNSDAWWTYVKGDVVPSPPYVEVGESVNTVRCERIIGGFDSLTSTQT